MTSLARRTSDADFSFISTVCDVTDAGEILVVSSDGRLPPPTIDGRRVVSADVDHVPPGPFPIVVVDADLGDTLHPARRTLRPGGLLAFAVPAGMTRAQTRTALFQHGFIETRLRRVGRRWMGTARRDPRPPPCERTTTLSVVLPVFNEKKTFREVMDALCRKTIAGMDIEIIVVESNSTDGTRDDVLTYKDHPRVRLILEDRPQGKGHAVRTGLAAATGDFILIQDADLEYSLDDYEKLLEPLLRGEVGFVLGSRHAGDAAHWNLRHFANQKHISQVMNIGHFVFATLLNVMYGQNLKDPFTMYKVFRRDCLDGLTFECNRFDFDWELVIKLIRVGFTPIEIPVSYHSRSFEDGKKVSLFGDPLSWIVACFKYRFAKVES